MSEVIALVLLGLLPAALSVGFYLLEKRTAFSKLAYGLRQAIFGVAFGGLAVLATECGIEIGGAAINVRDAAPLTAGLLFGAPAGIIAGVIGGVERWFAALWGVGEYTRLACSLATVLSGLIGAGARRFLFDEKKPGSLQALMVGVTAEVLHMLMIFLTNLPDPYRAFSMVRQCAGIMILVNSLSVLLSALLVAALGKASSRETQGAKKIAQSFQKWLLLCVCAAFTVTCLFTWALQSQIANTSTDDLLRLNVQDVSDDIRDVVNDDMLLLTRSIASMLPEAGNMDDDTLRALADRYDVSEINLIGTDGVICHSTAEGYVGYSMDSGSQSAFFLPLLHGTDALVQEYGAIGIDASVTRKYAGVALESGGFLQVGYDADRLQRDIRQRVVQAAKNRHIGQNGCVLICDENGVILSDRDGHEGESLQEIKQWIAQADIAESMRFAATIHDTPSYCAYAISDGYFILAALPCDEAEFPRDVSVYITVFMEIIVFAALFAHIYFLIKKLIVEKIRSINSSLSEITGGNLNVTVSVRSNEEFASLSDDINSTVTTLKSYIAEAAARIDKELEFARTIQQATLPSVFPPYPGRRDFDIYARMDAAKEVGGDFYDFDLLNANTLAVLIADVSGKGIPAAMFMMTAKTLIKGLAESGLEVNEIFTRANEKLCEENDAGMFVTAWMGIIDLQTGHVCYANAGHNPPAVRRGNGEFEFLRGKANLVLAGMAGTGYRKDSIQLMPGDTLYLYTDGVTEATDAQGRLFGEERLLQSLNQCPTAEVETLCNQVKRSVEAFVAEAPQFDDITMLMFRLNYLQCGETIITAPNAAAAELISGFLDTRIKRFAIAGKAANKLHIVADEICTNICSYSGASRLQVTLAAQDGELLLCFVDDGTPYDPLSEKEPDVSAPLEERETGGLGILMVRRLTHSAEYTYANGLNTLTLRLEQ